MARLPTFSNKRTLALIDDSKVDKKKILLPMNKTSHENFIKINQYNDPIEAEAEAEIRIKLLRTSPEERKKIIVAQLKNAKAPPNLGSYMSITERKKRDYKTVNWLKHLYDYQCQICGLVLPTKSGGFWIEAAHIKAKRDAGKETPDNLLILCPNHHKLFDQGKVSYELEGGKIINLKINDEPLEVKYIEGYLE
jgi:predicted restriction endonuclease